MANFDFSRLIAEAELADLKLPCSTMHSHTILVLTAYDIDLYQSWSLEIVNLLQAESESNLHLSNIGFPYLHRQRTLVRQFGVSGLRLLHKFGLNSNKRFMVRNEVLVKKRYLMGALSKGLGDAICYLMSNSFSKKNQNVDVKSKSMFSTFATDLATVEFKIWKHPVKVFSLSLAYEISYQKTISMIKKIDPCVVCVGNGRLVKAAAVVAAAQQLGAKVRIIERGAFPGSFDVYQISPHSVRERREQAQTLLRKYSSEEAQEISKNYIDLRKEYDPISGQKWQRNFTSGKLPKLGEKRICVCFTSTATEFAVFGDEIPKGNFQSQEEAFFYLATILDPKEWDVIIRRHPYGTKRHKKDPEGKLWAKVERLPNVLMVGPAEDIDSYELVRKADLVAHYNSSMGPEAISIGSAPVISMGPTIWENESSRYVVDNEEKLDMFLNEEMLIRSEQEIQLWGLYWASFGFAFQKVYWKNGKGFVDGKRII